MAEFKTEWITRSIDASTIQWAEGFAKQKLIKYDKYNKVSKDKSLTTTQIRKFFGELRRIQQNGYDEKNAVEVLMLKPKLAYAAGRKGDGHPINDFYKVVSQMIDLVTSAETFDNMMRVLEALVAYHKAIGGKSI